jgi:DNA-binding MarR family transcriptional regulator
LPASNYSVGGPAPTRGPATAANPPQRPPRHSGDPATAATRHQPPGDATTPTPTLFDTETTTRLRAVIGQLSRRLRRTAAGSAAGLTPTKTSILLAVVREGQMRLSAIAEAEGINPTMLSRVVAALTDAGLIERMSDESDRRAAWVRATPAARKLVEKIRRERTAALNQALAGLDEPDRRQIEQALPAFERLAAELKGRRS